MSNAETILRAIHERPGRKARQIAQSLGITRREVNSIIYGRLGNKVYHDTDFRWWPNNVPKALVAGVAKHSDRPKLTLIVNPSHAVQALAASPPKLVPTVKPEPVKLLAAIPLKSASCALPKEPETTSSGPIWIAIAVVVGAVIFAVNRSSSASSEYPGATYSSNYSPSATHNARRTGYEGLPPRTYGGVRARGYYRGNGTYVAPHYRSAPDGIRSNNWSHRGNTNPYTGKRGSRR
jgi:hypothetical protein